MSIYTGQIASLEHDYNQAQEVIRKVDELTKKISDMNNHYISMIEAQQLLTTVSDSNTTVVLDYITGIINKTLGELFPHDDRRIFLERTMHNGQHAHINIVLTGTNGRPRDLELQSGAGIGQVISFLFILSLVEIRKGRRLIIADELLNGLHPNAKRVITDIIKIFAEEGFQIVLVEYGIDDLGKIYLVEKPGAVATVTPLDGVYNNEVFVFNRPPEEVDISLRVEEGYDDEQ